MFCKHCGKEIDDNSVYCKYCGGNVADNILDNKEDLSENNQDGILSNDSNEIELIKPEIEYEETGVKEANQDNSQSTIIVNDEQTVKEKTDLHQTIEEKEHSERKKDNQQSKKRKSYLTIFVIAASILIGQWFITPMAKFYMKQRMKNQVESTGVYGAGLDRAEPIMKKIKKEAPYSLGIFGKLNKVSYGIGTIIIEFDKLDYDNIKNENSAKGFVLAQIMTMPNSMKKVLKNIAEEDFSLSIEIRPYEDKYSSYTIINLSPDEINQALRR